MPGAGVGGSASPFRPVRHRPASSSGTSQWGQRGGKGTRGGGCGVEAAAVGVGAGGCQAACSSAERRGGILRRARTRLSLARPPGCSQPKRRTRWKPLGSTCWRKRRRNSKGSRSIWRQAPVALWRKGQRKRPLGRSWSWRLPVAVLNTFLRATISQPKPEELCSWVIASALRKPFRREGSLTVGDAIPLTSPARLV